MSVEVLETLDTRLEHGEPGGAERRYVVTGTSDESAAWLAVAAIAPEAVAGLLAPGFGAYYYYVRQRAVIEPLGIDSWSVVVNWGVRPPREAQEESWRLSVATTGGTQHITQSLATIGRYVPAGKTALDFKGAIGVTHDQIEGVDIAVPVFNFSLQRRIDSHHWTAGRVFALWQLAGKVNSAVFHVYVRGDKWEFNAGELLFQGYSADEGASDDCVDLSCQFAASPNRTGIVVGDITGIEKKGWHYLWVRYADKADTVGWGRVKQPIQANVEQVYEIADFAPLVF